LEWSPEDVSLELLDAQFPEATLLSDKERSLFHQEISSRQLVDMAIFSLSGGIPLRIAFRCLKDSTCVPEHWLLVESK
jgi:hypothetical protein